MKILRRKKLQTVVKDTKPKDMAKGSTKGGKKKLLRFHMWYIYPSSGSYDLQLSLYQKIFIMKWNGDNWTIQNPTWLADERCTLSVKNVSWNNGDLVKIIGSICRPVDN